MVIAAVYPLGLLAEGICSVSRCVEALEALSPFSARVRYAVTIPQANDDIVYDVMIAGEAAPSDTLCEADYLIDWVLPHEGDSVRGFSYYRGGNHFRYGDRRLQEYHFDWDPIPFTTGRGGVQRNPQFAPLVPQLMAREIRSLLADSTCTLSFTPDTIVSGRHVAALRGRQSVSGYDGRIFTYLFEPETMRPFRVENEYNPGQLSEQSVVAEFSYPAGFSGASAVPATEDGLIALYPEVFERFRQSNFRVENLRGERLRHFSLPTLEGQRFAYDPARGFRSPAIIAFIDPGVASAAGTIDALRSVARESPVEVVTYLVFSSGSPDAIESVVGTAASEPTYGETVLISGKSLARDCGVTLYPAVIIADRGGVVREVFLGFNRSLAQNVIQAVALCQD